jgi:hypothetical protein
MCVFRGGGGGGLQMNILSKMHSIHNFKTTNKNLSFYLPTDAQEKCFKKNIKIYIKTAPTCFGLITIIRERTI